MTTLVGAMDSGYVFLRLHFVFQTAWKVAKFAPNIWRAIIIYEDGITWINNTDYKIFEADKLDSCYDISQQNSYEIYC
jgi:hypothetical protein